MEFVFYLPFLIIIVVLIGKKNIDTSYFFFIIFKEEVFCKHRSLLRLITYQSEYFWL